VQRAEGMERLTIVSHTEAQRSQRKDFVGFKRNKNLSALSVLRDLCGERLYFFTAERAEVQEDVIIPL